MNFFALFLTLALGLFILLGTLIVFITKNNEKFISFSLALALGVMSSLSVLELFPEAYHHLDEYMNSKWTFLIVLGFTLFGLLLLKLLDECIPHHADDEGHHHSKKEHMKHLYHISIVSSIALILHNIIEGMAVFGTAASSVSVGLLVGLGVGLHNIPMGMVIASTYYKSSGSVKKTILISLLISISTFFGGIVMILLNDIVLNDLVLGILLSITLGMLIYIVIFELLGQVIHSKHKRETIIGIILGILLLAISMSFGGHHH